MKETSWRYVKPLDDQDAVKNFLKGVGVSLPEGLVQCLQENNGGRPAEKRFDTEKARDYVFQSLLSYRQEDPMSISLVYPKMFSDSNYYPIGVDAAGNFICYDWVAGRYLLWKHETNETEMILGVSL